MKSTFLFAAVLGLSLGVEARAAGATAETHSFWPQWRGPLATGVAPLADPPLEWSESKNVKWKVKLPGFGTSTPIIWGDRVFILSAIPTGKSSGVKVTGDRVPVLGNLPLDRQVLERSNNVPGDRPEVLRELPPRPGTELGAAPQPGEGLPGRGGGRGGFSSKTATEAYQFVVLCLDRKTGKTLWQKVACEQVPHEGHHKDHGFASASPVTDGQLVFAFFGSRGLYCYDMEGSLKWQKEFGHMRTKMGFGEGASPALYGDKLIVNWDHEGDDFITALDKHTGKELWRTPRDEGTGWSTPLVVERDGKAQVVVNATGKVRSYDLATGKQLWECGGQTANAIPSPVADADTVYVTSGFRGSALFAFRFDRTGDLAGTDAIRWSHNGNTPYVPSPLLVDSLLYLVKGNEGVLSCFDAKTGKASFEGERLSGVFGIYASPVAAKDRVYVLDRGGSCLVLKQGARLEILATNKLDDKTDASLALVGNEIFLRGHQNLYCIAEK